MDNVNLKKNIVILTGAGISAESGIATFRDSDGLWCDHKVEDVATPEGFARDPQLVQSFYNMRRKQLKEVGPNKAHEALAKLEQIWQGDFLLITQNVDNLHEAAGSEKLIHMHGQLNQARCVETGEVFDWYEDIKEDTNCDCCKTQGTLRPHIVWFGEMPLEMDRIYHALAKCDLFLSIGTSGNVYPAAGFVQEAKHASDAYTIEFNLEDSQNPLFDYGYYGKAGETLPEFVSAV